MTEGNKKEYLFSVEILIEEETNGRALEILLHHLNSDKIKDFQIKSGMEIGKLIRAAVAGAPISQPNETPMPPATSAGTTAPAASEPRGSKESKPVSSGAPAGKAESGDNAYLFEQMQHFKDNNTLIRLTVVKGKGVKLSIPCRILNFDSSTGNVTIYHVDEKKVYLFKINEIDDVEVR